MKPFDLEAAKRGEPIQTRDGKKARFIAHVPEAKADERVVYLLGGLIHAATETGRWYEMEDGCETDDPADLFMAPKKKTVWVNFYRSGVSAFEDSQEEADDKASPTRIGGKAYPVEIDDE